MEQSIEAFSKCVVDSLAFEEPQALEKKLVEIAEYKERKRFKEVIHLAAEHKTGVFAVFCPNSQRIAAFKTIPPDDIASQSRAIRDEFDVATQNGMIELAPTIDVFVLPYIYDYRARLKALDKLDLSEFKNKPKNLLPGIPFELEAPLGLKEREKLPESDIQNKAAIEYWGKVWVYARDKKGPFKILE